VTKPLLKRFDDDRALGGTASQQLPLLLALRAGTELKKGEILKAPKKVFLDVANDGGKGLAAALVTLNVHMGVIDESCLPVKDLIALIGATFASNISNWEAVKDRAIAYFWTICLVDDWDSGTNDKTRAAFKRVQDVLEGRLTAKAVVTDLEKGFPDFDQVRDAASKTSLIYRTLMAFNLARRGVDWAGCDRSSDTAQEDHHIFPRDWLANNRVQSEDKQLWSSLRDSVLNRMYVSAKANSEARAQTPPNYLNKLTASERRVLQIPESFLGPLHTPIKSEDFTVFLKDRYDLIRADFIGSVRDSLTTAH
jgi:hypothetical protein